MSLSTPQVAEKDSTYFTVNLRRNKKYLFFQHSPRQLWWSWVEENTHSQQYQRKVNVRNQWPRNYLVNALTPQCLYHHFHDLFKSFTRNVRNQKMWKWPLLWPHDSLFHSESATTERKQVKIKLELDFQTFCFKLKLILKTKVRTCGMTKPFNLE